MTKPDAQCVGPLVVSDRRAETRVPADGVVTMRVDKIAVPGRVLDVSDHGMRVEHMYAALASGMVLEVETDGAKRTARVVWNRIKDDGVESGFYLL
jgi:PilZ domain